jgi:hydrogenase maturation protease
VNPPRKPILVLALGNDVMGDDGIGLAAARELKRLFPDSVDVVESGEAGLALLELLEGYDRALLVDAIQTGRHEAGTVISVPRDALRSVVAPSPHYAGLPEVFHLARRLDVPLPREIEVLAVEVKDPYTVREGLTPEVASALPHLVARASSILEGWIGR